MLKNKLNFKNIVRRLRYRSVEFDIEPYQNCVTKIEQINLTSLTDSELQNMSLDLIQQAKSGAMLNELLVKAYALIREASHRVLKMRHFDVQMVAGIALHDGNLIEMQTGEGKTLTAVLPAYLNALSGKGVHVLTFNDYLAQRDAEWMGPLYCFLGLTVAYIREGMTTVERQKAYSADITYVTAKEAGFDYLKGFLCMEKAELVQRPFHFAIVDEADSILIDEARIPLVIAGKTQTGMIGLEKMAELIRNLKPNIDYETDEYSRNVFLTDQGLSYVEGVLQCSNLYDNKNLPMLVGAQNALHAEVLLKRDVDYIVRNGKIELVDEFTGRIADKRHWPYGLQEAVEAKEGILSDEKGQILASITLQNFIHLYPKVCGMTGTAVPAADEFFEFYQMKVVVIPTNRPCIRADKQDVVFTHKEAKHKALISEITRTHVTGRPILIGTCSVEESEQLAEKLRKEGVDCQVLNAKYDDMEAKIISNAGALGAITVSTNMAGRGTDIKLGGEQEQDYDKVVAVGGLYVIGTNRHDSVRIDNQLKGRAGRQGDPGSSRFFISLEDDLLKRYRIQELIPQKFFPKRQEEALNSPIISRKILDAQRIVEGENYDIRRTLTKYSVITEQQRHILDQWRQDILMNRALPGLMSAALGERHSVLCSQMGEEVLRKAEKQVSLYFINKCWADYLDYISYIRESIHLVNLAGKIPVDEFNKTAVQAFEKLKEEIKSEIISTLARVNITKDGIDMEKEGLNAPTSTWTYLVNDRPEQLGINPISLNPVAAFVQLPLFLAAAIFYRYFKKVEKVD